MIDRTFLEDTADEISISIRNASCYWNLKVIPAEHRIFALEKINVDLKMNELTFVIGPVGGGKSAFLLALAGELDVHLGTLYCNKSIAYASQDPWIMNGTVKENILMGLPFDEDLYEEVIISCGLVVDIQYFEGGDDTIVGDKGVQCSGGQVSTQT